MKTKRPSLQRLFIAMFAACWILPVVIIFTVFGRYINTSIDESVTESRLATAASALSVTQSRVNKAIAASRNASYYPDLRQAYLDYRADGDQIALYNAIKNFFDLQYRYDNSFTATMGFFCDEPNLVYYTSYYTSSTYNSIVFYDTNVHARVLELSSEIGTYIGFIECDGRLFMVRNAVDRDYEPYAVIVNELNLDNILGSIGETSDVMYAAVWLDGVGVTLLDRSDNGYFEENNPIFNPETLTFTSRQFAASTPRRGNASAKTLDGRLAVYGMDDTLSQHIAYLIIYDTKSFASKIADMPYLIIPVILVIPFLGLAAWFLYANITKPLQAMKSASRAIVDGDLGHQVSDVYMNHDFNDVITAFNHMSMEMRRQFNRIYSEELALRDTRIMALQSQINPHFLNNTLEIINWEARFAGNNKVSQMIEALSTLLDAALDREARPVVPLSEELSYVNAYLYIISVRFGSRLTVSVDAAESLISRPVPRMALQPLIENAVEHGIRREGGFISICIYAENAFIIMDVENDGMLNSADRENIRRILQEDDYGRTRASFMKGLGIYNIKQRLGILYGGRASLTIADSSKGGTLARISVPMDKES